MMYFYVLQSVNISVVSLSSGKKTARICKKYYLLFNAVLLAIIAEMNYSFSAKPKNYQKSNPG